MPWELRFTCFVTTLTLAQQPFSWMMPYLWRGAFHQWPRPSDKSAPSSLCDPFRRGWGRWSHTACEHSCRRLWIKKAKGQLAIWAHITASMFWCLSRSGNDSPLRWYLAIMFLVIRTVSRCPFLHRLPLVSDDTPKISISDLFSLYHSKRTQVALLQPFQIS